MTDPEGTVHCSASRRRNRETATSAQLAVAIAPEFRGLFLAYESRRSPSKGSDRLADRGRSDCRGRSRAPASTAVRGRGRMAPAAADPTPAPSARSSRPSSPTRSGSGCSCGTRSAAPCSVLSRVVDAGRRPDAAATMRPRPAQFERWQRKWSNRPEIRPRGRGWSHATRLPSRGCIVAHERFRRARFPAGRRRPCPDPSRCAQR